MSKHAREQEAALSTLGEILDETRGRDRRVFLKRLGQVAAGSALLTSFSGVISSVRAQARTITTMNWGGSFQEAMVAAFFGPFEKNTGVKTNYLTPYNFAKLVAAHRARAQEVDALTLSSLDMLRGHELGMFSPLDWSKIDKSKLSEHQYTTIPNTIASMTLSDVIVYNTKKWPGAEHPRSWADFWDVKKFPGPRALERQANKTLPIALMADGLSPKDPKFYPLDADRAFKKLNEIKPYIKTWFTTGAQQQQMIENGEVDVLLMWNGRAADSILKNKAPYAIEWNQALYTGIGQGWAILTGAKNPDDAHKLLDLVGRAEPQAAFARLMFYGPANLKAYEFLDPVTGKLMPSHPDNVKVAHQYDYRWLNANLDEITRKFEAWLTA
jgi:putative spermidine/putrescine transport system substrate-binding protein